MFSQGSPLVRGWVVLADVPEAAGCHSSSEKLPSAIFHVFFFLTWLIPPVVDDHNRRY